MALSGPTAAPFGPPPVSTTSSLVPSAFTRVSRWPLISVRITEPSFIAIGPSGNSNPSQTSSISMPRASQRLFVGSTLPRRLRGASDDAASAPLQHPHREGIVVVGPGFVPFRAHFGPAALVDGAQHH